MDAASESDDIAQSMGFSSFGGPTKKRPHDDIAVSAPPASAPPPSHPRRPPPPASGRRHNPNWYEGYYDPSSNENPWLALEETLGLKSEGTWLPPRHYSNR
ncbi:hypothetical protein XA68_13042 [Ophiocordyceps unilateralis]|uniref:Uncharacterized protein n=1 Tax=Ophiocordyceps unilateralis TaxID=268505 RepID=A0A2A9PBM2_OPHUN|nr:hypothetical protein XA68_13042 [Ophiocordyceps unilateralis]